MLGTGEEEGDEARAETGDGSVTVKESFCTCGATGYCAVG